jgi:hypothetical protein
MMRNLAATALALFMAVAAAGCSRGHEAARALPPEAAKALLINRSWVDRLPKSVDDKLHVFRFTPAMGGGVYQDRTLFAGTFELFLYQADGKEIRFELVHKGQKKRCAYRIEELAEKGPEGVDLKLTIDGDPRGPSVYYSWKKNPADLDTLLAQILRSR